LIFVRVLLPLPDRDFDLTEVAVPWQILTDAGHRVVFATERAGTTPVADPLLLTGVLFGQLGAADEPKRMYHRMTDTPEYRATIGWADIEPTAYDGLLLPGGHAPGMRQYLGSALLQNKVAAYWALGRPFGAICHGVLVAARSPDANTGRSILYEHRTTCLLKYYEHRTTCLLKYQERAGYYLTAWRRGRYYRTYPAYVEDEVREALRDPQAQFEHGPPVLSARGTADDDRPAFALQDRMYLSARWPGDAYLFAKRFRAMLEAPPIP
jgi:putative intracellular protease/amidase